MSQCQGTHEQRRVCLQQQIRHPGLRSSELHRCRSCSMERLAHVQTHLQLPDVATVTCRTQHPGTPKERCPQCCPSSGHRSLSTREPCPLPSPAGGAQCPQAMTLGPAGGGGQLDRGAWIVGASGLLCTGPQATRQSGSGCISQAGQI